MKANIRLNLFNLIPSLLLTLLRNVIEKLTGNAALPNPPVALSEMTKAGDDLEAMIEDALQGSRLSREKRDNQVLVVRAMLTKTGYYVRSIANGDGTILAGSGFEMARERQRITRPEEPQNLKVKMGLVSGETNVRWSRVHGGTGYLVERCEGDPEVEANWKVVSATSKASFVDTDLVSFKSYFYRVSAIGFGGQGAPSAVVMGRAA